jgi:hypothetical protein
LTQENRCPRCRKRAKAERRRRQAFYAEVDRLRKVEPPDATTASEQIGTLLDQADAAVEDVLSRHGPDCECEVCAAGPHLLTLLRISQEYLPSHTPGDRKFSETVQPVE